ncbi:NUDIX domain-containing protein [Roseibium salinum]|uniref:NUDIX domain-containing protein n=1 Tax=Roseibium salinum TaxID=1604349 RepID=A0ABT3R9S2_9HYPH|nr:NUDIX domain-containing protein [Roseibium sp. DSM 29163]MCX2725833.1 NUDIX domain-containing protein [Roseibium sp. DSM 29163]
MLKILSILPQGWTRRLIQGAGLFRNPYTLGVRVIIADEHERVLLVRHSYIPGWYLPGGGVDRGETLEEAACREVFEEVGIAADCKPALLNIYLNEDATGRDHVGLFHIHLWSGTETFLRPNTEIVEAAFFPLKQLPDGLSPATQRRLREFRSGDFSTGGRW